MAYADEVLADVPLRYYRLGESSGTVAVDATATANGTYSGVTLGQPGLLTGDANTAVDFNGATAAYVNVPDAADLDLTSTITLEAWIRPDVIPTGTTFRSILTKQAAYSLQFNGPKLEFTLRVGGVSQRLQSADNALVAGTVYHVAGVSTGASQHLYVNGAEIASITLATTFTASTTPLLVGANSITTEFFDGIIDEAAVYGTALSAARVLGHYNAGTASVPTTTYRPASTVAAGGWTTTAASLHAALSDQNAATVITGAGGLT